ncbi:MAG TPA: Clp protease N-terminal domain-containing protein, partial [Nocardioidaceae bacterium]|nr:Clp protease N-terminal domain-containing protein [Nocardioidaceae bacterium]
MFERFSKDAKAAVVGAQQVAREAGSRSIDTRHLLVVLMQQVAVASALREAGADVDAVVARARADLLAGGLDGDALAGLGIDLDAVRRQADAVFGPDALQRAGRVPKGHIPFSRDAKK